MAANSMFRKVLFGGLNKADVEEYIQIYIDNGEISADGTLN